MLLYYRLYLISRSYHVAESILRIYNKNRPGQYSLMWSLLVNTHQNQNSLLVKRQNDNTLLSGQLIFFMWLCVVQNQIQNQNNLLVKRQKMTIPHLGLAEKDKSLAQTREVNLDMQSSINSTEEMSESGRAFQSLIVWGRKLFL